MASANAAGTESTKARVHLVRGSMVVADGSRNDREGIGSAEGAGDGDEDEEEVERGERCGTKALEAVCDDPGDLAEMISAAVEAARKVAAGAAAAAEAAGASALGGESQQVNPNVYLWECMRAHFLELRDQDLLLWSL